jgi:hypothetical protein
MTGQRSPLLTGGLFTLMLESAIRQPGPFAEKRSIYAAARRAFLPRLSNEARVRNNV